MSREERNRRGTEAERNRRGTERRGEERRKRIIRWPGLTVTLHDKKPPNKSQLYLTKSSEMSLINPSKGLSQFIVVSDRCVDNHLASFRS